MSRISKMNVIGIRSFPVEHGESIEFFTPLTLVVGTNGSGKTTIIECLKYATTGLQPPNSKTGGAFVHDPKLTGDREIMAQIKLQFYSNKEARMVLTRSLQLTVKKTTRSLRALEGSLLIEHRGEKTVISSRVAELDQVMPRYLGVSQAVLDNVIFCHQDESLWPLSEPSALKKKFDEIFESQKYTKAIENIKQIRKKHNEELAKFKIQEQHAREDRDRSEKARTKTEELSDQIEALRVECNDLQQKMDQAKERADKLWKDAAGYARILGSLEGKRIEAESTRRSIRDLKVHLKEVEESDEWLESTLAQFGATMAQYQEQREAKKEEWLEWEEEIQRLQNQLSKKREDNGKFEQEKEEFERQTDKRRQMVEEAASRHRIRGYNDLNDDTVVEEFLYKIQKMSKDHNSAAEKAREKADVEKKEALSAANRLAERKEALQDKKDMAKQQMAESNREADMFQSKVDTIKFNEGDKAVIDSRIDAVRSQLQGISQAAHASDWEAKLREANATLRRQEEQTAQLNTELLQSTKRAEEVARLSHVKQRLTETQRSLEILTATHGQRITQLIGDSWTGSNVEGAHQQVLASASRELSKVEKSRDFINMEMEQVQFKQNRLREDIKQKNKQVVTEEQMVKKTIGADIDEYERILRTAEENVEFARDQAKGLGGLADYFQKCLSTFESADPSCRTCCRAFKGPADPVLAEAKKRLKQLIDKSSKKVESAGLEDAEAAYKAVLDVGIAVANWKKLTTESVPTLEKEVEVLNKQKEALITKLEDHDKTVQKCQSHRKEIESITQNVNSIARLDADVHEYNKQIEELSTKQSQKGNIKTHEDIQEEILALNEAIRQTKNSISSLTTAQSSSIKQEHELQLELRDLKNELSEATSQLERKAALAARIKEYEALAQKQRDAIQKIDEDVQRLVPETATAQAKYEDVVRRTNEQVSELLQEAAQLNDTVSGLNWLNDQISGYIERGGEKRLTTVRQDIKKIEQSIEKAHTQQTQLTRETNRIAEQLRDSENTKRQYSDNLRYRQETRTLEQLTEEIAELDSRNANLERDRFEEESGKATQLYHRFSGEREGKLGEMKTKDNQLQELIDDFKTDLLDAPKRYREAHIKVETTKAAIADLQIFGTALDKAIMKFHSVKMEQVNDIIAGLWQKTYRGSDVDRIMIRSDSDSSSSTSSTSTSSTTSSRSRSYNYRVVMVKQGVEMDMRGRCSAGQKVLASIIIRLALADVFSQDCGLIALDEPTTNLDHDNIVSLAQSLHEIIQERKPQANFQLIIITHDEDFLRAINPSSFCEYYYRISRDKDGNSQIEKQDIYMVDK